jgi:DNA-binding NarL/FixJ family response regulator
MTPSKPIAHKADLKTGPHLEPAFSAVVVGGDSIGGDLLASALVSEFRCAAIAVRASNFLQVLGARSFTLAIISADVDAHVGAGFDLANAASLAYPRILIVILLDEPTRDAVINAFRSGARGVFGRQESMSEFFDCIKHVRKGFIWAGREGTSFVLEAFKNISAPIALTVGSSSTLTKRELQVVQCAAVGKTNKTIASELGLSQHTVKNYLFRTFEKLGVSSRVELLFYFTTHRHSFGSPRAEQDKANAED